MINLKSGAVVNGEPDAIAPHGDGTVIYINGAAITVPDAFPDVLEAFDMTPAPAKKGKTE